MIVAIDFDGTIVKHQYPIIGDPVPDAIKWMKIWEANGAQLILWTMRSGPELQDAVEYCKENGIVFFGENVYPRQDKWTESPKAWANIYVDDAAFGCPLVRSIQMGIRPYVDWTIVGPAVLGMIEGR